MAEENESAPDVGSEDDESVEEAGEGPAQEAAAEAAEEQGKGEEEIPSEEEVAEGGGGGGCMSLGALFSLAVIVLFVGLAALFWSKTRQLEREKQ